MTQNIQEVRVGSATIKLWRRDVRTTTKPGAIMFFQMLEHPDTYAIKEVAAGDAGDPQVSKETDQSGQGFILIGIVIIKAVHP